VAGISLWPCQINWSEELGCVKYPKCTARSWRASSSVASQCASPRIPYLQGVVCVCINTNVSASTACKT
jgi:hypothetical protein